MSGGETTTLAAWVHKKTMLSPGHKFNGVMPVQLMAVIVNYDIARLQKTTCTHIPDGIYRVKAGRL